MIQSSKWLGIVAAGMFAVVGCGGDDDSSGGGTQADLTEDQSAAVMNALGSSVDSLLGSIGGARLAPRAATSDFEATAECEAGGSTAITGSVTSSGDSSGGSVDFDVVATPTDCASVGDDGVTYALNGEIDLSGTADYTVSGTGDYSVDFDLNYGGTIDLAGGDLDVADCGIDVNFTVDLDISGTGTTGSAGWDGTICGTSTTGTVDVDGGE